MISINAAILKDVAKMKDLAVNDLIKAQKTEVESFKKDPTRIVNRKPEPLHLIQVQKDYLDLLINEFEEIVSANSLGLKDYKDRFDLIIDSEEMKRDEHKLFKKELINRMGYEKLRNDFYPKYFEQLGVKTCVYCNFQFALTVEEIDGTKRAKFQIDHYYPKSKYPCFSISFYNLYPVCGPCNNSKGDDDNITFVLYSENYKDFTRSQFSFSIDRTSLTEYRVNRVQEKLKINFSEPKGYGFNNTFAIEGIYNTQKDVAEEIVLKSIIYNDAYLAQLRTSLKKMYKNKVPTLSRLVLGNYVNIRDIHKRPMAKFMQDLAAQVELIKDSNNK